MARTISVADDVYEWMKKNKGEKSFSELIREMRKETDLKKLEGIGFSENWGKITEEVEKSSEESFDRIKEEYA